MASRFSEQIDNEQNLILAQFDVSRAKSAIGDLVDRVNSLTMLGRMTPKECKEILKTLKGVQDKIDKAGKNRKKR